MVVDTDNKEFQDALNLIQYTRQSVFLTGKAGTGKSTFLRYICSNIKKKHVVQRVSLLSMREAVQCTASSNFHFIPSYRTIPI